MKKTVYICDRCEFREEVKHEDPSQEMLGEHVFMKTSGYIWIGHLCQSCRKILFDRVAASVRICLADRKHGEELNG